MEVVKTPDGGRKFQLGPVEIAVAGAIPGILLAVLMWLGGQLTDTLKKQGESIQTLTVTIAAMQEQLRTTTAQLANVPQLTERVTRLETEVLYLKAKEP